MKKLLLILIPAALAASLAAQEAWPLERCIAYALEHNIDIRQQDNQVAVRQAEYLRRKLDHLPSLNARIGQDYNWGRSVDMQELVIIRNKLTKATGASLSATFTLFEGFSRHYARLAAGKAVEAAAYEAESLRDALAINVTRAFLELMLARQIHAYTCESYGTIVQQQQRTASLVDAGSQPKSALNELEAQVASEKATMVEASCKVRTAQLALSRLMNLPPDSTFVTESAFGEDSPVARAPVLSASEVEDYVERDARTLSAQSAIERQKHLHSLSRNAFLPTVSLSAGYGSYYSSSADGNLRKQMDENRNPSLSFQIGIPLFNTGQAFVQERQQRLNLEAARLDEEKVRTQIAEEIHEAAIEADNCYQKVLSAEETLQAVQSLLDITEARYNLGAATALDYIVARNNHFKAVSDYLQAKWQYLFQLKLLERYRR